MSDFIFIWNKWRLSMNRSMGFLLSQMMCWILWIVDRAIRHSLSPPDNERTKNKICIGKGIHTMHRSQPKDGHIKIVIKTPIWHNIENQRAKKKLQLKMKIVHFQCERWKRATSTASFFHFMFFCCCCDERSYAN